MDKPNSFQSSFQSESPVCPVGTALAVHSVRWPDRTICTEFGCTTINECPICKYHFITVPWCHTCKSKLHCTRVCRNLILKLFMTSDFCSKSHAQHGQCVPSHSTSQTQVLLPAATPWAALYALQQVIRLINAHVVAMSEASRQYHNASLYLVVALSACVKCLLQ